MIRQPLRKTAAWLSQTIASLPVRSLLPVFTTKGGFLVGVALAFFIAWWLMWEPASTTGVIVVGTPEVYTRERLVNDRFREDTWLKKRLEDTRDVDLGIQAKREDSASELRSVRAGTVGAATAADDQRKDAGEKDSGPGTPERSAGESKTDRGSANTIKFSPIDEFRDYVAYREDIRGAILETQLDDRHDIQGTTLYRLKFDATVIPQRSAKAWAMVYVELKEPPAKELANDYKQVFSVWRSDYETVINDNALSLSDALIVASLDRELANKVRDFLQDLLKDHPQALAKAVSDYAKKEAELAKEDYARYLGPRPKTKGEPPKPRQCPEPFLNSDCPRWAYRMAYLLGQYQIVSQGSSAGKTKPAGGVTRASEGSLGILARWLAFKYTQSLFLNLPAPGGKKFSDIMDVILNEGDCATDACRLSLKETPKGEEVFSQLIGLGHQIYVYSVTPKELVQRVASMASRRLVDDIQLLFANKPNLGGEETVKWLRDHQQRQEAMLRKPLVVGVPHRSSGVFPALTATRFSWVIGPRAEVDRSGNPVFAQIVSQVPLSAVISVPSWWKSISVKVATCWVDERILVRWFTGWRSMAEPAVQPLSDIESCQKNLDHPQTEPYAVYLPGNTAEIARKLGFDPLRRPMIKSDPRTAPITVTENDPARIVIEGNHLWRSTVVTLDAQPAEEIIVLPNMKGIIAVFGKVQRPSQGIEDDCSGRSGTRVALRVWTSEGMSPVGYGVCVAKPDKPGGPKPPGRRSG